jgi:hypothetical protein
MANMMDQYRELITDSLFEEAFLLLEQNVNKIDDLITRNKHIRDFFTSIFEDDFFNEIIDRGVLFPVAHETVKALFQKEFLKDTIKKFGNYVDAEKVSVMFVFLLQNNEFDSAKALLPFFNNNITGFPKTLNEIIENKNLNALDFMCSNMSNIHFNEGALLRTSSEMNSDTLRLLVEKYKFDINEQSKDDGFNLVHTLVSDKNLKNFKFIVDNYGNQINWAAKAQVGKNKQSYSVLDLVDLTAMHADYYSIILDDLSLKGTIVDRIATTLLLNDKILDQCCHNDVYTKLFSHPNFDPQISNMKQDHLLYGLLSAIGTKAKQQNDTSAKNYLEVLNCFLHTYVGDQTDTVNEAVNFHVVGAAVQVAKLSESKIAVDAAGLIIRRYKQYINKPNPSGELPIGQVEKDSPIYRLLLNNGAIPAEPEPGFWNVIARMMPGNKKKESFNSVVENTEKAVPTSSGNNNLISVRNKMREDFRAMRGCIANPLCDPIIKFKCENMFLKSERLVNLMERYNITQSYEDLIFLGKNFSDYLKNSLESYVAVCEATVDFSDENRKSEKLEKVKNQCLSHVELLAEQLDLISQNIANEAEGNATRNLNVRGRFLENRFQSYKDLGIDAILDKNKTNIYPNMKNGDGIDKIKELLNNPENNTPVSAPSINQAKDISQQIVNILGDNEEEMEVNSKPSRKNKM